jgi:NADH-quinone oxidoreductase subunit L
MPATARTFLIGTLALCGLPPLSGFYSKDAILAAAAEKSHVLFGIGVGVAALTTFYMFRLVFVVFWGRAKSDLTGHAHESPRTMTWPLIGLAFASVVAGILGIQQVMARQFFPPPASGSFAPWWLHLFLNDAGLAMSELKEAVLEPLNSAPVPMLCGLGAIALGFLAAWGLYRNAASDPLPENLPGLCRVLRNKFYFDELYAWIIACTQDALAQVAAFADRWLLAGGVRFVSGGTELLGRGLRLVQCGNLQTYAFLTAAGIALALYLMLRS